MKIDFRIPANYRHRSLWMVVLTSGLTMIVTAALLPGSKANHPVQAFSKQTRAAGAVTFHEKGCEHCHGIDGIGTERGPDLSGVGKRSNKDHIEKQIREGGGGMPPFAGALQSDEIKDLVDFLSAKRKATKTEPKPPVEAKPASDDSGL